MRALRKMSPQARSLSSKAFLLKEMVVRDVRARYSGSSLGLLWAFALPVLWMVLYTVVFSLVLRVPVEAGFSSFPEFLLPALLPWMAVQEGISRSASSLVDNASMVKKTVFPVETLVLSVVLAAVVNELVALAVFAVYVAALGHLQPVWLLLLIPAVLLQTLLAFGIGCIAATMTAFLRDTVHAIGIVLTVLFYDADRVSALAGAAADAPVHRGEPADAPRGPVPPGVLAARRSAALVRAVSDGVFPALGGRGGCAVCPGASALRRSDLTRIVNKDGLEGVLRSAPLS